MKLASVSLFLASAMPAAAQGHRRAMTDGATAGNLKEEPTFNQQPQSGAPYVEGTILASYTSLESLQLINEHVNSKESYLGEGNVEVTSTNKFSTPQQSYDNEGSDGPSSVQETVIGYVVIKTDESNVAAEMEKLSDIPGVQYVERDRLMRATTGSTSHGRRLGPEETRPWGIDMVNVKKLWPIEPSSHIKICVVDTGYDLGHIDLPKENVTGWNPDPNHPDFETFGVWDVDLSGHGTHVAGTIGAIGGNDEGVVGVNPDPTRFSFHIAKGLNDTGWGTGQTVRDAVSSCCVNAGAKVISMSLGCPDDVNDDPLNPCYSRGYSDIEKLFYQDVYGQDVMVIAVAGNDGYEVDGYPASYETVVSVASVQEAYGEDSDFYGYLSGFSTFHDQVELAAPGSNVLSTIPGDEYDYYSGTSMACPHVSGIAALLWSHFPDCKNNQIRNAMIHARSVREPPIVDSRNAIGWDMFYGWGIVNAGLAYDLLLSEGCEGAGGTLSEPLSAMASGGSQQKSKGCVNDEQCFIGNPCFGESKCGVSQNTCYQDSSPPCEDDGVSCTDTCTPTRELGREAVDGKYFMCNTSNCRNPFQCDDVKSQCVADTGPLAPFCTEPGAPCTSGNLLQGVGSSERWIVSDTIDGCLDGTLSKHLVYESVEDITVTSNDDQDLQAGHPAKISTSVFPYQPCKNCSIAHFYHTEKVDSNAYYANWNYLGSVVPNVTLPGLQTLEMQFTPSIDGIHAVRVSYGYLQEEGPCVEKDGWFDVDDLVFTVAQASGDPLHSPSLDGISLPTKITVNSDICDSLTEQGRCVGASSICQWSGNACNPKKELL